MFAFAMILTMSVLSSCSSTPSNEEVKSILDKEKLTEADYGKLIDYVDASLDATLPVLNKVKDAQKDGDFSKLSGLESDVKEIQAKYPYAQHALFVVETASKEDLGESNAKKYDSVISKAEKFYKDFE